MQKQPSKQCVERSLELRALLSMEPFAAGRRPPRTPRARSRLSGRPACRIFARVAVWILEIDRASGGWLVGDSNTGRRLVFPSLAAAIGYAERYGLDYRIEPPPQHQCMRRSKPDAGRLPRSWLARLAHNGRKGDIYHG